MRIGRLQSKYRLTDACAEFAKRPKTEFVKREGDEDPLVYLARVRDGAGPMALTLGEREVGRRLERQKGEATMGTWTVDGVPRSWTPTTLEEVLQRQYKNEASAVGRPYPARGAMVYRVRMALPEGVDHGTIKCVKENGDEACTLVVTKANQSERRNVATGVPTSHWAIQKGGKAEPEPAEPPRKNCKTEQPQGAQ